MRLTSDQNKRNQLIILGDFSAQSRRGHKDIYSRHKKLVEALSTLGQMWYEPDPEDIIEYFVESGISSASIEAYWRAIRAFYRSLLESGKYLDLLLAEVPAHATNETQKAFIEQSVRQIENVVMFDRWPVGKVERRHRTHIRLQKNQAEMWLAQPEVTTLTGLRDFAVMSLMLCTGLRDAEAATLQVEDLWVERDGELMLHVRDGVGCVPRHILYRNVPWLKKALEIWLNAAGIAEGPVFRAFYRNERARPERLSIRAIKDILANYPIEIDGEWTTIRPLDIRYTYARRLYEIGAEVGEIQEYLGFANPAPAIKYIGRLDVAPVGDEPEALYHFDLPKLDKWVSAD